MRVDRTTLDKLRLPVPRRNVRVYALRRFRRMVEVRRLRMDRQEAGRILLGYVARFPAL